MLFTESWFDVQESKYLNAVEISKSGSITGEGDGVGVGEGVGVGLGTQIGASVFWNLISATRAFALDVNFTYSSSEPSKEKVPILTHCE